VSDAGGPSRRTPVIEDALVAAGHRAKSVSIGPAVYPGVARGVSPRGGRREDAPAGSTCGIDGFINTSAVCRVVSSLFVDTVTEDQTGTTLRALAHGAVAAVLASAGVASLVALGGSSAAALDPAVVLRALFTQVGDATPGGDVTTPGTAVLPAAVAALAAARFVAHAGGDAVPGDDDDPWVAGAAGLLVAPGYLLVLAAGVLFVSPPVTTAGAAVTALGTGVAAATGGVAGRVARRGQPVARAAAAGALVSFAATALSVARFLGATAGLSSPEQQLGPYAPAWVAGSWSVLSEYGYAVTSTTSFESLGAVGVYTAPPGGTVVLLGVAAFFAGALLAAGRDTVSAPVVGAGIAAGALATTALLTSLAVYSNGVRIWMAFDVLLVLVVALVGALGAGGAFAGPRFAALPGLVRDPPRGPNSRPGFRRAGSRRPGGNSRRARRR
jgi:hypothetical protein